MTSDESARPIMLPALRGVMGSWVHYTCLMPLKEVASRVQFAEELHSNRALSDLIQRRLDQGRGKKIAS